MQQINELERRITAALARIGTGVDSALQATEAARAAQAAAELKAETDAQAAAERAEDAETRAAEAFELATASAALERERGITAELRERLAQARDRETVVNGQHEERIEKLMRQLDMQGLELQRMRKSAVTLREELRHLREAQSQGLTDPTLINRALLAEVDALRATRLTELAELEELTAAL